MINAIRLIRIPQPRFTTPTLPPHLRFHRVINLATVPENSPKMDDKEKEKENETTGDIMSHSFGEGYASRSEEEGFGGTYGGNQSFKKKKDDDDDDKSNNRENHPEYDKSQGSEVKEKEKSRHQTHGNC